MLSLLGDLGFWAVFLPFGTGAAIAISAIICTHKRKMRELEAAERERERAHELLMLGGSPSPLSEAEGMKLRLEALEKELSGLKPTGLSRVPPPSAVKTGGVGGAEEHLEETP